MAVLGKRKADSEPAISEEDAAAIFRRHFEAQFAPLPDAKEPKSSSKKTKRDEESDEEDDGEGGDSDSNGGDGNEDGEEWGGLSGEDSGEEEEDEEEQPPVIEVVDHSGKQPTMAATMSKRELKAFMVIPAFMGATRCKLTCKTSHHALQTKHSPNPNQHLQLLHPPRTSSPKTHPLSLLKILNFVDLSQNHTSSPLPSRPLAQPLRQKRSPLAVLVRRLQTCAFRP
jgi:hypothetical protein